MPCLNCVQIKHSLCIKVSVKIYSNKKKYGHSQGLNIVGNYIMCYVLWVIENPSSLTSKNIYCCLPQT